MKNIRPLIKECILNVLKENLQNKECFDPTSCGPNPEASEGLSDGNPYAAWNNKMRQMEDMDHPLDDKTRLPSPHPADQTTRTSLPQSGEEKYLKQQPGGQMAAVNCNEGDGFDRFRQEIGAKKVNEFLSKFGLGPDYKPSKPKLHECPQCKKCQARYKEMHADTDMNEMVLECPDCGYSGDSAMVKESMDTWESIRRREDPEGKKHDITLVCPKCGNQSSCRCMKPKRKFEGICPDCA